MEKKIYIVQCSSGSWDSFSNWIGGIFEDQDEANALCKKKNEEAERVKRECPIQKDTEDMSEEEYEIYYKWFAINSEYSEWNEAVVIDYDLNKEISRNGKLE